MTDGHLFSWRKKYQDTREQARKERGETLEEEVKRLRRENALALRRALAVRNVVAKFIFHSDRGGEFASHDFRNVLSSAGAEQSLLCG